MTSNAIMLARVAFFTSCKSKSGGVNVPLAEILEGTQSGTWAGRVNELRRAPYKSEAYEAAKVRLHCFMLSATTATGGHKASDIGQHTGLMQIDVDDVGQSEAVAIRDRLGADPHILAAWLSPGAAGVKGAIRIPANLAGHRQAFEQVRDYLAERYAVTIDKKCSDPCRLCFVSFDPDMRINPDAIPMVIAAPPSTLPEARLGRLGRAHKKDSSTFLPSASESPSCILHNTHGVFDDFPALLPFYDLHVRRRLGTPARGLRNAALVELVAGTFCVVHPRFVLAFAEVFHRERPDLFADYPHHQWMREADAALTGCLNDYAKKNLGPTELSFYTSLSDDMQTAAFRICRSLAMCDTEPGTPPPEFFLSADQLATRLGILAMQAWRIMKSFEKKGVVVNLQTGTLRQSGQRAKASRWRWCLPLPSSP